MSEQVGKEPTETQACGAEGAPDAARQAWEAMTPEEIAIVRRMNRIVIGVLLVVIVVTFGWTGWWVYRKWFYVPSTEDLVEQLSSEDLLEQLRAVDQLRERTDEEAAVHGLAGALQDRFPVVRARAAEALEQAGRRAALAVEELIRATRDDEPFVRQAATRALAAAGVATEPVARALLARMGDPDDMVQSSAQGGLIDLVASTPALRPMVEEALADMPEGRRRPHLLLSTLQKQREGNSAAAPAREPGAREGNPGG